MSVERRDQRIESREARGAGPAARFAPPGRWGWGYPAFTLPELLVVIAIAILLLAIAVPAFSSMLYSSRRSGSAGAVQTALAAARDVALESGPGRDAAAVFFADPGGRMRIMVAVQAGEISDITSVRPSRSRNVTREVFVRSDRVEPIGIPAGWGVSGRARANTINEDWYEDTYPSSARSEEHWVFPETAMDSPDERSGDDGASRQTFMVRFAGGSGALTYGDDRPVLVIDPVPTRQFRGSSPWDQHDVMDAADLRRFVQRVMSLQGAGPQGAATQRRLLGDEASDTVLARPVGQVAVYSLRELARGIGARGLNPVTGSLYEPALSPDHERKLDTALFSSKSQPDILADMDSWISGQPVDGRLDSDAQIFTIQRYLGRPLEAVAIGEAP